MTKKIKLRRTQVPINKLVTMAEMGLGVARPLNKEKRGWIRTPLGGFINHSEDPNCFINENIHYHDGTQRELYVVKPIRKGEEITIYYTLYKV